MLKMEPGDQPSGTRCPRCAIEMVFGTVEGVKCVLCPACRGTLAQGSDFAGLVRVLRAAYTGPDVPPKPIDPGRTPEQLNCPACEAPMDNHVFTGPGNVVIDSCPTCEIVWLDEAELEQIIQSPGSRKK